MKWFNYKRAHEWYGDDITNYPDDINQIIRAFETLEGVRVSPYEAAELWRLRSDAYDASWLGLPECDDDVIKDIKEFVPGFEIVDSEQEPEDDGEADA